MNYKAGKSTQVVPKFLNIACGGSYISAAEWENIDYAADESGHVARMNILSGLNPSQPVYNVVYCSHFIEHIPYAEVSGFLARCRQLTASDGLLRIVVPDAEFLLREFLRHKDAGNDALAEFAFINFLDQCVRQTRGGRLGEVYKAIALGQRPELVDYAVYLNGAKQLQVSNDTGPEYGTLEKIIGLVRSPKRIFSAVESGYVHFVTSMLPRGFRAQNVSFADVGERHQWMYDFDQLSTLLEAAGYSEVSRQAFDRSRRLDGFFDPLDVDQGEPRKGYHQLFIEAYP